MKIRTLSIIIATLLVQLACVQNDQEKNVTKNSNKIPVYAWMGGPGDRTDDELKSQFQELKSKGIDVLMYNGGQDPDIYLRVGSIAKSTGLGFHTWIPTMVQSPKEGITNDMYAMNGLGESALDKPAYVDYYKFLCPSNPGTYQFLEKMYGRIADVDEVDAIHLDYIRYPDVILAKGLWEKYGLVMDREYPQYDYCYCETCTDAFFELTGIDILHVEDPSKVEQWKQFRYDLITGIVNRLVDMVHSKGKQINAAVFPGPNSIAKKIVRQEWDKWDLDAFFPMNYNDFYLEDTEWIGEVTHEAVTTINEEKPVFSGLFICPNPENKSEEKDPENHGLLPEELGPAIRESMENGATGICLFTPGRMTEAHWVELEKAIFVE